MRIFVLHRDPLVSASLHCDADILGRTIGMAQVLSSVYKIHDELEFSTKGWQTKIGGRKAYSPLDTDKFIEWASETVGNYLWCRRNLRGLLDAYQLRWGDSTAKRHKTWEVYYSLQEPPRLLRAACINHPSPMTMMTPFVTTAAPVGEDDDVVTVHRMLYRATRPNARYTVQETPDFMLHQPSAI